MVKNLRPRKPRPDFPLFPHASGRWAKKIRGKFQYFGKVADDPEGRAALDKWLDQRDELLAGLTPRVKAEGGTVRDLVNRYLTTKQLHANAGEITLRTFRDPHLTAARVVRVFGKDHLVIDLAADDF
jgi:hypothetical protein